MVACSHNEILCKEFTRTNENYRHQHRETSKHVAKESNSKFHHLQNDSIDSKSVETLSESMSTQAGELPWRGQDHSSSTHHTRMQFCGALLKAGETISTAGVRAPAVGTRVLRSAM